MVKRASALRITLMFFLTILAVVALVGVLHYHSSSQLILEMTERTTKEAIHQSSAATATFVSRLKTAAQALAEDDAIKQYAKQEDAAVRETAHAIIERVLATDEDLVSAVLVTHDGRILSNEPMEPMALSHHMMNEPWYPAAVASSGMPVLVAAHQNTQGPATQETVISVTQEVVSTQDGQHIGVLRLDIRYHALAQFLAQLNLGNGGYAFIVDAQQQPIYQPEQATADATQWLEQLAQHPDGYFSEQQFVYHAAIPNADWTIVGVATLEAWQMNREQLLYTTVLGSSVVCLVALTGMLWLVHRWLRPLSQLQATMQAIESGNRNQRAPAVGTQEMQAVAQHFNRMLDTIDRLMMEVRESERAARQHELIALASQINPHFLYNTLDTIIWMAEFNDSSRVVALTKALSQYFRLALNQGESLISLENELAHVQQYLFIQQQRYGAQLQYHIDDVAALTALRLPKLVLQPLVENAVYHGIKGLQRTGIITITVRETDTHMVVAIYDNGRGMPQEMTEQTNKRLGGVGIHNVVQRLRLYFGSEFSFEIDSEKDDHTCITLFLPKISDAI